MPATTQGKEAALAALQERRAKYKNENWRIKTEALPAGSPMYFGCLTCNAPIEVPEMYTTKPDLCFECQSLRKLGWLE